MCALISNAKCACEVVEAKKKCLKGLHAGVSFSVAASMLVRSQLLLAAALSGLALLPVALAHPWSPFNGGGSGGGVGGGAGGDDDGGPGAGAGAGGPGTGPGVRNTNREIYGDPFLFPEFGALKLESFEDDDDDDDDDNGSDNGDVFRERRTGIPEDVLPLVRLKKPAMEKPAGDLATLNLLRLKKRSPLDMVRLRRGASIDMMRLRRKNDDDENSVNGSGVEKRSSLDMVRLRRNPLDMVRLRKLDSGQRRQLERALLKRSSLKMIRLRRADGAASAPFWPMIHKKSLKVLRL